MRGNCLQAHYYEQTFEGDSQTQRRILRGHCVKESEKDRQQGTTTGILKFVSETLRRGNMPPLCGKAKHLQCKAAREIWTCEVKKENRGTREKQPRLDWKSNRAEGKTEKRNISEREGCIHAYSCTCLVKRV